MKPSFKSYDDFQEAHTRAKYAAAYTVGLHWKLVRGASVMARLPAAWVAYKAGVMCSVDGKRTGRAIRICRTPRDVRLPAACFWEDGVLPVGPEYFEEYAWEPTVQFAEAA